MLPDLESTLAVTSTFGRVVETEVTRQELVTAKED